MTRPRKLQVDMIACTGHGLCAELLPELVRLDGWGYPILDGSPVPDGLTALGPPHGDGMPGAGAQACSDALTAEAVRPL